MFGICKDYARASLSPFHADGDINLGNGIHQKFKIISNYVSNEIFSICEDGFGIREMTSIWKLYE